MVKFKENYQTNIVRIIIIGGGRVGATLANWLVKEKNDVILIEKNQKLAEELAEKIDALVLNGDGSSTELLKEANIENADIVIAMTGDDKTNLLICEIAKANNVSRIISRVNEHENEIVFRKAGISNIVNTTRISAEAFKKLVEIQTTLVEYTAGGNVKILEICIPENSKLVGKKIRDVEKDITVVCIYRDGEVIMRRDGEKIKVGDVLTICIPIEKMKKVEKMFSNQF